MAAAYQFVEDDTASKLAITILDDASGAALNLAGCTVTLNWRTVAGVSKTKTMTITGAATGEAEYQFAADELEPPSMSFEVRITDASAKVLNSLEAITVKVRARIVE